MSGKTFTFRISLEDAEKLRAQLEALGKDGAKALEKLDEAGRKPTAGLKLLNATSQEFQGKLEGLSEHAGGFSTVLGSIGPAGLAAGAALGGLVAITHAVFEEFMEGERVANRLNAVLKATGNTTGLSVGQLDEFASQTSKSLALAGGDIKTAMGTLATFNTVAGASFKGVIEQAANLSATFGGDLNSNTAAIGTVMQKLADGEAVNLRKAFGFLRADQIHLVEQLAESGKGFEAQKALIKSLQEQIGGSAEAGASGLDGSVKRLTESWKDLLGAIGNTDAFRDATSWMARLADKASATLGDAADRSAEKNIEILKLRIADRQKDIDGGGTGLAVVAKQKEEIALLEAYEGKLAAEKVGEEMRAHAAEERAKKEAAATQAEREAEEARVKAREAAKEATAKQKAEAEAAEKAAQDARDNIDQYIQKLGDEGKALQMGERDRASFNAVLEAEAIARRGNIQLTEDQIAAIKRESAANYDRKKAEADAKKASDEAARIVQHSSDEVVDFVGDMFAKIGDKNKDLWDTVSETMKSTWRKAIAQMAAEAVIRPIITPILSSVVGGSIASTAGGAFGSTGSAGGGLGSSAGTALSTASLLSAGYSNTLAGVGFDLGQGAADLFGASLGGSAQAGAFMGNVLGNAGYGAIGSLGANLFGLGSQNQYVNLATGTLGTLGGAAIGTSMGTILGLAGGPVGAIAGGFLGTALGGLFGGSKPSNHTAYGLLDLASADVLSQHTVKGTDQTRGMRDTLVDTINQINAAIASATGLTANGTAGITVGTRDKTKLALTTASGGAQLFTDRAGETDDLLKGYLSALPKVFDGLSSSFETVLKKGGDLNTMLGNLDFAATYDQLQKVVDTLPAAAQSIKDFQTAAEDFAKKADSLGLDGSKALAAYGKQYDEQVRQAILAITDPAALALETEQKVADQRLATAKALGADILEVERLNALEREQIIEQQNSTLVDNMKKQSSDLIKWIQGEQLGDNSSLSSTGKLQLAQSAFDTALADARNGGDVSDFTSAANNLLSAAKSFYGGASGSYADQERFVLQTATNLGQQVTSQASALAGKTSDNSFADMLAQLQKISASLADMEQNQRMGALAAIA